MSNGITFGAGPFVDGTTYQGSNGVDYLYLNGCMVIAAAEDIDTVDGYSMPAVAPAGVVDSITGLPIEAGAPVTVFFDANGDISGYKDCTDMDTFGTLMTAASGFTDSAGNVIVAGDQYILLADGSTVGAEHTADTDTFAELIFAGSAGIDDAGNAYDAAAPLIMLANGDLVCVAKTIDTNTYSLLVDAAVAGTDDAGNIFEAGDQLLELPDGQIICVDKTIGTDTFTTLIVAGVAGTDAAGNNFEAGSSLIQLPSGELVCVAKTIDTDTFSVLIDAPSAGTDDAGNQYIAGSQLIQLPSGQVICAEKTTDTDTFSTTVVAATAGADAAGNVFEVGDVLIQLPDGSLVCAQKTIDTVGSITANQEGVGGGVGTASISFPATSLTPATQKDNAVCGVQSNSVLDPATGLITTELNDESTLVSCENQYKGLRDNGDGTKTEIFVNQDGDEVTGLTLDKPTQTGEPQLGSVLADGTTTYIDGDGNTQTVPATDVDGNPVDPSQSVWNMVSGTGAYLGSKPCANDTVLLEDQFGNVEATNSLNGNQVRDVATDCNNKVIDLKTRTLASNEEAGIYRQIFLDSCPEDCVPPTRTKLNIAEIACDPTGKTWKAEIGEADWTPVKCGFYSATVVGKVPTVTWFVENEADGALMSEADIEFINPTCDPMCFPIELEIHGELKSNETDGFQMGGMSYTFDGATDSHYLFNNSGAAGTAFITADFGGPAIELDEYNLIVPPKTTVIKKLSLYNYNPSAFVGKITNGTVRLRSHGTTICDLSN